MAYRTAPRDPRPSGTLDRFTIPIPTQVLARRGGRVLDPDKAGTVRGRRVNPTAYVADELVVQGPTSAMGALVEAAKSTGHDLSTQSPTPREYTDRLGAAALAELAERMWVSRFRLQADPVKGTSPDAWTVLQRYRELVGDEAQEYRVGLNHLVTLTSELTMTGAPLVEGPALGVPYYDGLGAGGNPLVEGPSENTRTLAGRSPVTWLGRMPGPTRSGGTRSRSPVVAVLDTGLGTHDWLGPEFATLGATVNDLPIGLGEDVPDPEVTGVVNDPLRGGLDRDAGHGTFIAGIIRQVCPDAHVLAVRVMPSDGVVDEHKLTIALNMLLVRQAKAQLLGTTDEIIDVMSLSLGYYHETPDDVLYTSALARTLQQFGQLGVAVVASAGNDSTRVPMFPAGLASSRAGQDADPRAVPILSVGALNPNGTVALFSNAGDWVSCHRPGAAVISTFPTTFDGSRQPTTRTDDGREDVDPDDFASGFGVWSGTSFSAPVLAAELAQHLLDSGSLEHIDAESAVTRGWAAVQAEVGWERP